jgi:hypothetical protein
MAIQLSEDVYTIQHIIRMLLDGGRRYFSTVNAFVVFAVFGVACCAKSAKTTATQNVHNISVQLSLHLVNMPAVIESSGKYSSKTGNLSESPLLLRLHK